MANSTSEEAAEHEFNRFMELMDLGEPDHKDEEDMQSFLDSKYELINAMMAGRLYLEDDELIYMPKVGNGDPIRFPEPDGEAMLAMDQAKESHSALRGMKLLSALTGLPEAKFKKMKNRDYRVVSSIAGLFFQCRSRRHSSAVESTST